MSGDDKDGTDRPRGRKAPSAFRTISEVADELHIPQHVLRFWETKFPQLAPLKRGGGRRYYRPEDIELLRRISDLLYIQGYTIKGVQRLLRDGPAEDEAAIAEAERAAEAPEPGRPQLPLPGLPAGPAPARAAGAKPVVRVRAEGAPATVPPASDPRAAERLAVLKAALAEALQELGAIRDLIARAARRRG
ncbi:MerR family transcriptional regulator [Elioraea tepidiphila]|jgi:DNA-binding transcriptional MerR regulator|uniref:MerR family transcriptional regulator n=1 Tax=Elioraea tepidiphila TaxID=457934 RepID=UPI000360C49D|nr:MerR family transcriptional regulator [Elioraea tepidiphila]